MKIVLIIIIILKISFDTQHSFNMQQSICCFVYLHNNFSLKCRIQLHIMSEQFCFIIDKRSLITCTRLFLHVRVFLPATSCILSKCIPYVTGIKLLDTKVLESQLHGTNSCVRLLDVKLRNEKTLQCRRDRKAKEIKTDHYCVSLENSG